MQYPASVVTSIVHAISESKRITTFGGGQSAIGNPIADALKEKDPSFAMGVDVGEVVSFVLAHTPLSEVVAFNKQLGTED